MTDAADGHEKSTTVPSKLRSAATWAARTAASSNDVLNPCTNTRMLRDLVLARSAAMRCTNRFESAGITDATKNSFAGLGPEENALLNAPWRGSSPVPRAL